MGKDTVELEKMLAIKSLASVIPNEVRNLREVDSILQLKNSRILYLLN